MRVDALARMMAALTGAGFPSSEALDLGRLCARRFGLTDAVIVDVTPAVTVAYVAAGGESIDRTEIAAGFGGINCQTMKRLDQLAMAVIDGELDARGLADGLDDAARHAIPNAGMVTLGMSLLSFAIALQVGIGWLPALLTALVQAIVTCAATYLGRWGIRRLFLCAGQAIAAGLLLALMHVFGWVSIVDAAAAVGVPWLLAAPLPILVEMVVDLVREIPAAALARAIVVVVGFGGVAIGALIVLTAVSALQVPSGHHVALPALPIALGLLFSVIGALANALANGGAWDLLVPAGVMGLVTAVVNQSLIHGAGFDGLWAASLASVVLGFIAAIWSRYSPYPTSVLALMGITGAILPGLAVYAGIAKEVFGASGTGDFVNAGLTGVGIGVGVALGVLLSMVRERALASH